MREVFAEQFNLSLRDVKAVTLDIGGAFGTKHAAYPDEMSVGDFPSLDIAERYTSCNLHKLASNSEAPISASNLGAPAAFLEGQ